MKLESMQTCSLALERELIHDTYWRYAHGVLRTLDMLVAGVWTVNSVSRQLGRSPSLGL